MAQEGIQMEKMQVQTKHFVLVGVDDATLIAAFKENRQDQVEEQKARIVEGKITVEIKFNGKNGYW